MVADVDAVAAAAARRIKGVPDVAVRAMAIAFEVGVAERRKQGVAELLKTDAIGAAVPMMAQVISDSAHAAYRARTSAHGAANEGHLKLQMHCVVSAGA